MSTEAKFLDGLIVKAPHPNAPDFVKMKVSINRKELIASLKAMDGDWVNLDVKESKGGKMYAEIDEWTPEAGGNSDPF